MTEDGFVFSVIFLGSENKPPVLPGERKTSGATIKKASFKQAH